MSFLRQVVRDARPRAAPSLHAEVPVAADEAPVTTHTMESPAPAPAAPVTVKAQETEAIVAGPVTPSMIRPERRAAEPPPAAEAPAEPRAEAYKAPRHVQERLVAPAREPAAFAPEAPAVQEPQHEPALPAAQASVPKRVTPQTRAEHPFTSYAAPEERQTPRVRMVRREVMGRSEPVEAQVRAFAGAPPETGRGPRPDAASAPAMQPAPEASGAPQPSATPREARPPAPPGPLSAPHTEVRIGHIDIQVQEPPAPPRKATPPRPQAISPARYHIRRF